MGKKWSITLYNKKYNYNNSLINKKNNKDKITCIIDGRFFNLLYIDTTKKHDLTILKTSLENQEEKNNYSW